MSGTLTNNRWKVQSITITEHRILQKVDILLLDNFPKMSVCCLTLNSVSYYFERLQSTVTVKKTPLYFTLVVLNWAAFCGSSSIEWTVSNIIWWIRICFISPADSFQFSVVKKYHMKNLCGYFSLSFPEGMRIFKHVRGGNTPVLASCLGTSADGFSFTNYLTSFQS